MRPYFAFHPDSFALLPCLSLTLGRAEDGGRVEGVLLHLDFLSWTFGIEVDLYTHS